jgi:IclR family pca regulon transcriptional regulator
MYLKTLEKGLSVLSVLAVRGIPLGLTELSRMLPQSKSSLQRITYTLGQLEYLHKDQETRKYVLGTKAFSLGFSITRNSDLRQVASRYLRDASEEIGETVNLAILDGPQIVYVERVKTQQILNINLEVGSRLPAYCTSMGKAMLAHLPEMGLEDILKQTDFKSFTSKTPRNAQQVRAELERVRQRGFAVNDQELADGLRSVAAPVRDQGGEVIAAVNIAVPSIRFSLAELETTLAAKAMETADKVSQALAYKKVS